MKSSTAIAIGVGAAAAVVIGIAAAVSAKPPPPPTCTCPTGDLCQSSSGTCPSGYTPDPSNPGCCIPVSSTCTCPSGDVCPDSNGVCPSGYIPDPNAAGCCAKCVQAAPCSCSEIFDTVLCECSELIPATVDMPISFSVYPFWMVYNGCTVNGGVCSGYEGENISACRFVSGECNHDALEFTMTGKVTDSSGHPICNVPLDFSSNLSGGTVGTIPWATPDGNFEGIWEVGISFPTETDSNGNFAIVVHVSILITHFNNCCIPAICPPSQQIVPMSFPLTLTASIPGTQIEATSIVDVANTICEWLNY